jgi:hypothetical protein
MVCTEVPNQRKNLPYPLPHSPMEHISFHSLWVLTEEGTGFMVNPDPIYLKYLWYILGCGLTVRLLRREEGIQ